MEILKIAIIISVINLAIIIILLGIGMLSDYYKNKEIEKLMYGIALPCIATLMLYLFFHIIKF